jgi:hypothetical protein
MERSTPRNAVLLCMPDGYSVLGPDANPSKLLFSLNTESTLEPAFYVAINQQFLHCMYFVLILITIIKI